MRVLFSLFGIKCSVLMSNRLWLSLHIRVNLFFFLLVSNVSHFRSDNMSFTLAVLLKFWRKKTSSFSLNSLQGWNIFFVVWVPWGTCLLQFGSDNADIGRFTYFPGAVPEISLDQPPGSTRLAWDRWNVFGPL